MCILSYVVQLHIDALLLYNNQEIMFLSCKTSQSMFTKSFIIFIANLTQSLFSFSINAAIKGNLRKLLLAFVDKILLRAASVHARIS